jgi:tetratricopeptide (TPR) repeat protein
MHSTIANARKIFGRVCSTFAVRTQWRFGRWRTCTSPAEEWRDLVEVLERQAAIVNRDEERAALYRRLGRIWGEKLDRDRNALEAWQQVLEIDPNDLAALYAVAAIHRNMQAWEELVETLRRLIDLGVVTDMAEDELWSLYGQLGELLGEILLRPQEAIDAWRKALELRPEDLRAMAALEQLLSQEARWEECIDVLQRKAAVIEDVEQKIDVLMQTASLWQERVENDDAAADVYEQLLALDNGNETAFVQLEQIYREGERWEKLVDLLLARVELIEAAEDSVEMLQRVASIYEQKLDSPEHAFEVLRAAFRSDYANDITVKELERLASITNRWSELLSECQAIEQTVQDPHTRTNMLVNMSLWYSELGHLDYAIPSVQRALQIDPESRRALDALSGFYRRTGSGPSWCRRSTARRSSRAIRISVSRFSARWARYRTTS